MKTYLGNYLGLVVGDNDPDQRGRVQVFIPHIMPTIYEGWNREGLDIKFNITGDNVTSGLTNDIILKLQRILPWAECAAPIFGAGPAGKYNSETGELDAEVHNRGSGSGSTDLKAVSITDKPPVNPSADKFINEPINTQTDPADEEKTGVTNTDNTLTVTPEFTSGTGAGFGTSAPTNTLDGIPNNVLRYVYGIGAGETGFNSNQAYSSKYLLNEAIPYKKGNNGNNNVYAATLPVGTKWRGRTGEGLTAEQAKAKYGDFGYYQTNKTDGFVNTGTLTEQTISVANNLKNISPAGYQAILAGDFKTADTYFGKTWFGINDQKSDVEKARSLSPDEIKNKIAGFDGNTDNIAQQREDLRNQAVEIASQEPIIPNPSQYFTGGGPDTNYTPTGMFGSARIGQLVWVFFQEGNPLFPVYFAASYGQKEWANVNQHSSPDPVKDSGGARSSVFLDGGGFRSTQIVGGEAGFQEDEFSFEIFGKNGSNFNISKHVTQLNSKYDFRQHTQGDHHSIVGGNREIRTVGDHNTLIEQDCIVTIGNWTQEALDAAAELQQIINDAMNAAKQAHEASSNT